MDVTFCFAESSKDGSYRIVSTPMTISQSLFKGLVEYMAKELSLIVVVFPNSHQK